MSVDRARHGQLVCDREHGDCFRAAMSVLLDLPNGDRLPGIDETGAYWHGWRGLLAQFGIAIGVDNAKGPIWKQHKWIASVPSKNFDGATHAIVMRGHRVYFDPSPRRRYHAGWSLLGKDVVLAGYWLEVADVTLFPLLDEFRRSVNAEVPDGE